MDTTPIRFDPQKDLEPTPFDAALCGLALTLKQKNLGRQPHVGCFVWDPDGRIAVARNMPASSQPVWALLTDTAQWRGF
jgi:hypothetical protein